MVAGCLAASAAGCGTGGRGGSGTDSAIEVIFRTAGTAAQRDAVAARCGYAPAEAQGPGQERGRRYEPARDLTQRMLDCLKKQPEVERLAFGG